MDHDRAALIEIDENLIREDLSPAARALHIARRKDIYERLHPETKHGATPGKRGGGKCTKDANLAPFAIDTAKRTKRSTRDVQRDAARAKAIRQIAEVVNTSLDKGEELDALATLPPEKQAQIIARAKAGERISAKHERKKIGRQQREQELAVITQQAAEQLGHKLYGVIYADPPWRFEPYSRETGMDRAADNHYPTLATGDIADLSIPAAPDCVLFLWTTVPTLPQALDVMRAWGFTYRSHFVWV